jgi:hypothetical protein
MASAQTRRLGAGRSDDACGMSDADHHDDDCNEPAEDDDSSSRADSHSDETNWQDDNHNPDSDNSLADDQESEVQPPKRKKPRKAKSKPPGDERAMHAIRKEIIELLTNFEGVETISEVLGIVVKELPKKDKKTKEIRMVPATMDESQRIRVESELWDLR